MADSPRAVPMATTRTPGDGQGDPAGQGGTWESSSWLRQSRSDAARTRTHRRADAMHFRWQSAVRASRRQNDPRYADALVIQPPARFRTFVSDVVIRMSIRDGIHGRRLPRAQV